MSSKYLAASGEVTTTRTRLLGATIAYKASGKVAIRNGGAAGDIVYQFEAASGNGAVHVDLNSMLCPDGAYVTLTDAYITVLYE